MKTLDTYRGVDINQDEEGKITIPEWNHIDPESGKEIYYTFNSLQEAKDCIELGFETEEEEKGS